jgi:hypothetical protein
MQRVSLSGADVSSERLALLNRVPSRKFNRAGGRPVPLPRLRLGEPLAPTLLPRSANVDTVPVFFQIYGSVYLWAR